MTDDKGEMVIYEPTRKRGGKRPGAGRKPTINGVRMSLYLPRRRIEYLRATPNASRTVRDSLDQTHPMEG